MPPSIQFQNDTTRDLGMVILQYGDRWPELRDILEKIYVEKAADIPWFPSGWLARVQALHGFDSMLLLPSTSRNSPAISFLDTPAKKQWWDEFHDIANKALLAYADGQAAAGRKIVDAANADAAFWDRAYRIAVVLASPVTAVRSMWANPLSSLALLAAGVFVYVTFIRRK